MMTVIVMTIFQLLGAPELVTENAPAGHDLPVVQTQKQLRLGSTPDLYQMVTLKQTAFRY